MLIKATWNVLMPGLCAGAGAITATQITGDPYVAALAAAVGAVAGALLQERDELSRVGAKPPTGDEAETDATATGDVATGSVQHVGALPLGYGRILLERMPLGIIVVAADRSVVFVNPAGRALFGQVAERPFAIETLRTPRLIEAVDEVRRTRTPAEADIVVQRRGAMHLTAHAVPLKAIGKAENSTTPPDVLIALEDRSQARQAEVLHRDFVANASHELKTPLAALSGLIETLLGHGRNDPEAQARFLPMMAAQTDRMRQLVEDLLSLNRIELNERLRPREPQPLALVVAEVVETLRPTAGAEGLVLSAAGLADEANRALRVPGVREELAQAVANLIENAVKYGRPAESESRMATAVSPAAEPIAPPMSEIRVMMLNGTGRRRGMVGIAVEDDGPGIAREHLPRLTERFYRVSVSRSRERGGTGLGLAIVKHVVNRHRGTLEIDSTIGVGSRFTIWLPLD
ncbi:MAG: ATP-binding protein [Pseudomonadota bacterium]